MDCPVLFVDFDGVLRRSHAVPHRLEPELIENLHHLMRRITTLRVVFSTTTWRLTMDLHQLRQPFVADLRARFIGVTPDLSSLADAARHREILAWRRAAAHTGAWIAVDDQALGFPERCTNLCLCDPRHGFDAATMARCMALLVCDDSRHSLCS